MVGIRRRNRKTEAAIAVSSFGKILPCQNLEVQLRVS
jgi:hypothetical protein